MRKISLLLLPLAALSLASCVNDSLEEIKYETKKVCITARVPGQATRVQISETDATYKRLVWNKNDVIKMFSKIGGDNGIVSADFTYNENADTAAIASFSGEIKSVVGYLEDILGPNSNKIAVYPSSESVSWNESDSCINIPIPSVQIAPKNSFDPKAFPSIAKSNSLEFGFYNIASGIYFQIPDSTGFDSITSISVSHPSFKLTGTAHVKFDSNDKPVVDGTESTDSIVKLVPTTEFFVPGNRYYLTTIPGVIPAGLTVTFYKRGYKAVFVTSKDIEFARNKFNNFTHFDSLKFEQLPIEKLTINHDTIELNPLDTFRLQATVFPETALNKKVIWESSDSLWATVDSNGLVKAIEPGKQVIITAKADADNGVFAMCTLNISDIIDLSKGSDGIETANCYIIPNVGLYKFNARKCGKSNTAIDGTPTSCSVLWETYNNDKAISKGDLVQEAYYKDDYIFFTVPNKTNGNALIAVKDKDGTILWSWHLWISMGFNPDSTAQVYKTSNIVMMDRNLGALTSDYKTTQSYGMFYQWGRKDPFVGARNISGSTTKDAVSTSSILYAKTADIEGSFEHSVKNPTTFYCDNSDWIKENTSNYRWDKGLDISDPCPKGWTIPTSSTFSSILSMAFGNNAKIITEEECIYYNSSYSGINLGNRLLNEGNYCFYPFTGYKTGNPNSYTLGYISTKSNSTNLWSRTLIMNEPKVLSVYTRTRIDLSTETKTSGCCVRCIKE